MSGKAKVSEGTIADLRPLEHNPRRHTPRGIGMIVDSLHQVGAGRSIVVDENNTVLAGNGTLEAAAQAGIENIVYVETDGKTLVATKRVGLTEEQKAKLAIFDNRTSELSDFDPAEIAVLAEQGMDMTPFFSEKELSDVLTQAANSLIVEDPLAEWKDMPEFEQEDASGFRIITVHFATQEDVDRFAKMVGRKLTDKTRTLWFPEQEISRETERLAYDKS